MLIIGGKDQFDRRARQAAEDQRPLKDEIGTFPAPANPAGNINHGDVAILESPKRDGAISFNLGLEHNQWHYLPIKQYDDGGVWKIADYDNRETDFRNHGGPDSGEFIEIGEEDEGPGC